MRRPHHAAHRAPPLHAEPGRPDRGPGRTGRVADIGTHAELSERCPLYRQLLAGPEATSAEAHRRPADAPGHARVDDVLARPAALASASDRRGRGRPAPRALRGARRRPEPWAAARRRRRRRRGITGTFGSLPPTPELLAQVDALPPATDTPDVDAAPGAGRRTGTSRCAGCCGRWPSRCSLGLVLDGARRRGRAWRCPRWSGTASTTGVQTKVVPRDRGGLAHRAGHRARPTGWSTSAETLVAGRTGERLLYTLRVQDLRPAAAARPGLLRARAVRPDHDPDDHRRRRAVHVPADRAGHRWSARCSPSSACSSRC